MPSSSAIRIGMIGLDTSHCPAFTDAFHQAPEGSELAGLRVVAAVPAGNPEIPLSRDRVGMFTDQLRAKGVEMVSSIEALLPRVDAVMIQSVDGGQHLEQARAVFGQGKRVFIDKPPAATLRDALAIVELGERTGTAWFSSSSLRFMPCFQRLRAAPGLGELVGCDAFSQTRAMPGHGELAWYGIHGIEILFTLMGTGCRRVVRTQSRFTEQVAGVWGDGRIGNFRGIREHTAHTAFGATVFGTQAILHEMCQADYKPMLAEIARFFRGGAAPVPPRESLEIMAFIAAADESLKRGGAAVSIDEVMAAART